MAKQTPSEEISYPVVVRLEGAAGDLAAVTQLISDAVATHSRAAYLVVLPAEADPGPHALKVPIAQVSPSDLSHPGADLGFLAHIARLEQRLSANEERSRLISNSISDYAILALDVDNRITDWNTGAENILGWTESEAIGQMGEIIFTEEDRAAGAPAREIKSAIKNGRAPDERFHVRKNGSRFYASGMMTLVRDKAGVIVGFAKILRDLTSVRATEKAVREREGLQRLITAQEEERMRLARDLHDALGQELTLLRLHLDRAASEATGGELLKKLREMEQIAARIDEGIDRIAWELRPMALADLGLIPALEKHVRDWAEHYGIEASLVKTSLRRTRFRPEVETNLYRIVQEALNNVAKHAKAKSVVLILERRGKDIVLVIEDDGRGFSSKRRPAAEGIGLTSMRERAELIGGSFEIESSRGKGTTIYIRIKAETATVSKTPLH